MCTSAVPISSTLSDCDVTQFRRSRALLGNSSPFIPLLLLGESKKTEALSDKSLGLWKSERDCEESAVP